MTEKQDIAGPAQASLASRRLRREQTAGRGMQRAGMGVKAGGMALQGAGAGIKYAGRGVKRAGLGMMRAGAALSSTGLGAIAGVPLAAAGALTAGAGVGAQWAGGKAKNAGQKTKNAGRAMSIAGKLKEKQRQAKGMTGKAKEALAMPIRMGANRALQWAWLALIPSYGLSVIWIYIHGFLRFVFGEKMFCRYGDEWIPKKMQSMGGEAGKTMGAGLRVGEGIVLGVISFILLFIIFLSLIIVIFLVRAASWSLDFLNPMNILVRLLISKFE